jgi:monothiol glutaredoxin
MPIADPVRTQLDNILRANPVVLFMKGTRHFPQCGFSATVVGILGQYVPKFETVNVLSSPELREGIKEYSSWPTIPQLYVGGKFVGGCDIVREMHEAGELAAVLGVAASAPSVPAIKVTEAAAEAIRAASKEAGGDPLRVEIGPRFEVDLYFDAKTDADFAIETSGVTLVVARDVAPRAHGIAIDYVHNAGFRIENPNAPPRVKSMDARELQALLASGEALVLLDVRTDAEIRTAKIEGARPLTPEALEPLSKSARIVVHCHHGVRSRRAAEQLVAEGFTNVFNLEGGIDAYSSVDPTVPRY